MTHMEFQTLKPNKRPVSIWPEAKTNSMVLFTVLFRETSKKNSVFLSVMKQKSSFW